MKASTLLSMALFCLIGTNTNAQLPPSVSEQLSRPLFAGVQPKDDAKTNVAFEASIKMQVKDKIEAMEDEQIKTLVLNAYRAAGYKDEEIEQWIMMPAMTFRFMAISAVMQTSRDDTLLWSGVANPFVDEQPPQLHVEKFGNQHPNYDPKKPFWQASDWIANNFKDPNSAFKFDYTMRMQIISPEGSHSLSVYLNSKDGSMGIDGSQIPSFFSG